MCSIAVALLTLERQAMLYGKAFSVDGTARPLRVRVIGKDGTAFTAELADGAVHERGARVGLDGLGFFEVLAIVRTQTAGGERVYLRLWPTPNPAA